MKYVVWLWRNSRGIRWNSAARIVVGIGQVVLGLLMVWLSRRFIDETIRTGTADDVMWMVLWLVLTVVGGVVLRQVGYWLTTSASIRQSNALRLRLFSSLFRRQLFSGDDLHSGDVSSRLAKDIEQVSTVCSDTLPQMVITMIQLCGAFLLMQVLAWAGYDASLSSQAPGTLTAIRALMSLVPAAGSLLGLVCLLCYPLGSAKMKEIQTQLEIKRNNDNE